jgi:hypothetical protein
MAVIERKTTRRQFMDGFPAPAPVSPPGEGWRLAHVAAATGSRSGNLRNEPMCALLFFIWEREVRE